MNPNYIELRFPQIKAHPWHKVLHKRMPPEAIDLASRLLQYSPSLCCIVDKMEEVQLERQVDGDSAYREVMRSNNSINHMQLRKCSVMSKGKSKRVTVGGIIIPDEYLQPLKDQIVKDTVGELMKTFKQQLQPETFAYISQTLGVLPFVPDLENDEQRDNEKNISGGINDQEYVQDQEDDEVE